jgi:hypothetical protein
VGVWREPSAFAMIIWSEKKVKASSANPLFYFLVVNTDMDASRCTRAPSQHDCVRFLDCQNSRRSCPLLLSVYLYLGLPGFSLGICWRSTNRCLWSRQRQSHTFVLLASTERLNKSLETDSPPFRNPNMTALSSLKSLPPMRSSINLYLFKPFKFGVRVQR